jgi:dethiobiotin synthetase
MAHSYFVTGTDTGVGKTLVSSALVYQFARQGLRAVGMKPVASGCVRVNGQWVNEDVSQLLAVSNLDVSTVEINPYAFEPAIAPHVAAAQAGVHISLDVIAQAFDRLSAQADVVIVEGAGGFYVPLDDRYTMADLAKRLDIPVILVVGIRLGCINHALLSVDAIKASGLPLAGWVANQVAPDVPVLHENIDSLRQRIHAPCLAVIPWQAEADVINVPRIGMFGI